MIGTDLEEALHYLQRGELIGLPTETVYGLAGNALRPETVSQIFAVKNRPVFDPLIVHVADIRQLDGLVQNIPPLAARLAEACWPGPLTLLLPRTARIPDLVTSGLPHVAVRVPAHPLARQVLGRLDFPLAAPSANPFGYISPTTAAHVEEQLGGLIPYVLDGGPCPVGVESTIVGFQDNQAIVLRKGGLPLEALEALAGPLLVQESSSSRPAAPGLLESHYAPRTPLRLWAGGGTPPPAVGVLSFSHDYGQQVQEILSPTGDMPEAARNLFAALRRLDAAGVPAIYAELLPETGLGRAINDRLRRAATKAGEKEI